MGVRSVQIEIENSKKSIYDLLGTYGFDLADALSQLLNSYRLSLDKFTLQFDMHTNFLAITYIDLQKINLEVLFKDKNTRVGSFSSMLKDKTFVKDYTWTHNGDSSTFTVLFTRQTFGKCVIFLDYSERYIKLTDFANLNDYRIIYEPAEAVKENVKRSAGSKIKSFVEGLIVEFVLNLLQHGYREVGKKIKLEVL